MTDEYIENHFADIISHEDRYDFVYINGCKQNSEEIILIGDDYERIIEKKLKKYNK